ncbi:MAG TPA: hypothetical protein VKG91_17315, partial [Roseiarcus sp.]|nr:hypothetical protein [Roseiarcus sp.]
QTGPRKPRHPAPSIAFCTQPDAPDPAQPAKIIHGDQRHPQSDRLLGPAYLPAYAAGVRAGITELGPHLLGHDPTEVGVMGRQMDRHLKGHPYIKSPIDMACWDILGKAASVPISTLLGGCSADGTAMQYSAIGRSRKIRLSECWTGSPITAPRAIDAFN